MTNPKILMVFTSHSELGETGEKKDFGWKSLAHLIMFSLMRADITLASPKGGQSPVDPKSGFADLAPGLRFGKNPVVSGGYLFQSA